MFILPVGLAGRWEAQYTNDAIIKNVSGDEIVVEDTNGMLWTFEGTGFEIGEKVVVTWDDNHTDNRREDDKIIKVKHHTNGISHWYNRQE